MNVILDIPEDVLNKYKELAKTQRLSRKSLMEIILINNVEPNPYKYLAKEITSGNIKYDVKDLPKEDYKMALFTSKDIKGTNVKEDNSHMIFEQIKAIKAEVKPSFISKKSWQQSQQKRITELEKQLPQLP